MKQLRYVGSHSVVFVTGNVGELQPGDEFRVPDDLAPRFLAREDVVEADASKPAKPRKPRRSDTTNQPPSVTVEDDSAAGSDGDDTGTAE